MAKRLLLGVLLAIMAVSAPVVVWVLRGDDGSTRAQGDTVEMGIDPEITGNTASTLGTLEYCVRVDVESPTFDDVSDYNIDVYVQGDTEAPMVYDAWITYDAGKVHIAAPGSNTLLKLPGASNFSDALPDADGEFVAGAIYLSGGPGTAGDGALVRLGLDIGDSGLVAFDFDPPAGAATYTSADGGHPITRATALLAINEDCPPGGRPEPSPPAEGEENVGPPITPYPDKPVQAAGRYRWGNISIDRPEGDIYITRDFDIYTHPGQRPYTSTPVMVLSRAKEDGGGSLIIDANTGEVLSDNVSPENRGPFDAILTTLRIEGSDAPTGIWPYNDAAPVRGLEREWQLDQATTAVFLEPDPEAGILVFPMWGDSSTESVVYLIVRSARSAVAIDTTGAVVSGYGHLDPADADAFDRLISSIEFRAR